MPAVPAGSDRRSDPSTPDRTAPSPTAEPLEYERHHWSCGRLRIAGIDEVGRGPLAGPVVAAAVVLPEGCLIEGVDDSKKLSPSVRRELAVRIRERAAAIGLGAASVREIDRVNILVASTRAMNRALRGVGLEPDHVVVDGLPVRGLDCEHEAIVGGDGLVHSIGCASIIAKVVRDRLMLRLAPRWPEYGWDTNMGYGTEQHREAIELHGPTPHHRLTFVGLQYDLGL